MNVAHRNEDSTVLKFRGIPYIFTPLSFPQSSDRDQLTTDRSKHPVTYEAVAEPRHPGLFR